MHRVMLLHPQLSTYAVIQTSCSAWRMIGIMGAGHLRSERPIAARGVVLYFEVYNDNTAASDPPPGCSWTM